jgi:hypothetical protein
MTRGIWFWCGKALTEVGWMGVNSVVGELDQNVWGQRGTLRLKGLLVHISRYHGLSDS